MRAQCWTSQLSEKMGAGENKLEQIAAQAQRNRSDRERGYRERSLKMYPWVCGRCAREFTRANLQELTVHHRDHNHDNNPQDGSNWELLCVYCHDNEHSRLVDASQHSASKTAGEQKPAATHKPFSALASLLKKQE